MTSRSGAAGLTALIVLTNAMFFMFAMTTDAVGEIIQIARGELELSNTQASAFHWSTMIAIALSGIFLGSLADRIGHRRAIVAGLAVYGTASLVLTFSSGFLVYLVLLFAGGLAIGVFKTAALALIGDLSHSTADHTRKMNTVEGFFGLGAIAGPLIVVLLNENGLPWNGLYLIAALLCAAMVLAMMRVEFPAPVTPSVEAAPASSLGALKLLGNREVLGFSLAIALYVACEVAIFVWLPTLLATYPMTGLTARLAPYAVMSFFVLRAAGRFLGVWLLTLFDWKALMLVFCGIIFACFLAASAGGPALALYALPVSGLFMSMIYPTLNSKGISCVPKSQHGAAAGLILFFTALSAAFTPLAMGFISDAAAGGDIRAGFVFATVAAGSLFLLATLNAWIDPVGWVLKGQDKAQYGGVSG